MENESLRQINENINESLLKINKRMEDLERRENVNLQYNRINYVEISGIPANIPNSQLEEEVRKIYDSAKFVVNDNNLRGYDIEACHRIGKKGSTIVKFMYRKFAEVTLYNGKQLKDIDIYGPRNKLYINNSFCKEFGHINYVIRNAVKGKTIFRYKIKHGVNLIMMNENSEFVEITNLNDLMKYGVVLPN